MKVTNFDRMNRNKKKSIVEIIIYFCGLLSDNETFIISEIIIEKVVKLMAVFIICVVWKDGALRVSIGVASF